MLSIDPIRAIHNFFWNVVEGWGMTSSDRDVLLAEIWSRNGG